MSRLQRLVESLNAELFNPVGLNIVWPRPVAFLFVRHSSSLLSCNEAAELKLTLPSLSRWRLNTIESEFRIGARGTNEMWGVRFRTEYVEWARWMLGWSG